MPPAYSKPFRQVHKNDFRDAHAVAEAVNGLRRSLRQFDTKTVEVSGARVHLSGKEHQILQLLSLRRGTTLTSVPQQSLRRNGRAGEVRPESAQELANASGGKDYIETVWGRGYVLREP